MRNGQSGGARGGGGRTTGQSDRRAPPGPTGTQEHISKNKRLAERDTSCSTRSPVTPHPPLSEDNGKRTEQRFHLV